MLTWAMVYLIHNGTPMPGVFLMFAMMGDVAMVIAPFAIIWGAK